MQPCQTIWNFRRLYENWRLPWNSGVGYGILPSHLPLFFSSGSSFQIFPCLFLIFWCSVDANNCPLSWKPHCRFEDTTFSPRAQESLHLTTEVFSLRGVFLTTCWEKKPYLQLLSHVNSQWSLSVLLRNFLGRCRCGIGRNRELGFWDPFCESVNPWFPYQSLLNIFKNATGPQL